MQLQHCRTALINTAASGNTTVVPANQLGNGVGTIKVWQVLLNGGGANVITFSSGATAATPIPFTAAGASATLQATGVPWFTALPGQALIVNMSTAAATTGMIYYTLA